MNGAIAAARRVAHHAPDWRVLQGKVIGLRGFGSAALSLAWVAAGRLDAAISGNILATNGELLAAFKAALKEAGRGEP